MYYPQLRRQFLSRLTPTTETSTPPSVDPAPLAAKKKEPEDRRAARSRTLPYEENHQLERDIKKLDLAIYHALDQLEVPEENVYFLKLESRRKGSIVWDHALIEADLTSPQRLESVSRGLEKSLNRLSYAASPQVSVIKTQNGVTMEVRYDGLHTHTLYLVAANKGRDARDETAPKSTVKADSTSQTERKNGKETSPAPGILPEPPRSPRPRLALVIDDFGLSQEQAVCFIQLKMPLAFSILPFLDHSREIARLVKEEGGTIMLHLPMQPEKWPEIDSGPGTLLVSMKKQEVVRRVEAAVKAVPFSAGANNHMGSRFTQDAARMEWVLEDLRQNNLFFLDSLTSPESKAYETAQRLGLKSARRTIFIDHFPDSRSLRIQLKRLVTHARQHGSAIGIGHPYPVTCQTLKREYNYLKSNVKIVPITNLVQ